MTQAPLKPRPTRVRYLVVALAALAAVLLYLDRICLAFTERYMAADLGLSNDEVGWLLSAFFWTYALAQVPAGWLGDRYGVRLALTLYIAAWSLFTGAMGLAGSFAALLACRLGCGLAQAGAYPASAALLSVWVPFDARARASGVVATGGRVGGFLAPVLTAYLMGAFAGGAAHAWRPALVAYGVAGVLVALAFWLGVRDRPADHPACNTLEAALIGGVKREVKSASPVGVPWRAMGASRSLWLSSLNQFGTNFGWAFLITWFPRYLAEAHAVPVVERGWLASLPILVGMAGMLAGGWATDRLTRRIGLRWGRSLPLVLTRLVGALAFAACPLLDSAWGITAALCAVAVTTDLGVPAVWAYMQDVGGRSVGAILGWGNMWGNLGAAVSPVVLNAVIGPGRWDACFLACAAALALSGVAALGIDARIPVLRDVAD